MRLVKVSAPAGSGKNVADTAFAVGVRQVSIYQTQSHQAGAALKSKDTANVLAIIIALLLTYILLGFESRVFDKLKNASKSN